MSTLVDTPTTHSRAYRILRAVVTVLVVFEYWRLASDAISFAERRSRSGGDDSSLFTVYTLVSFGPPLALAAFLALAMTRFAVKQRIWITVGLVAVLNWAPLVYAITRGIKLTCEGGGSCR